MMIYKSSQMHDIAEQCSRIAQKDKDVSFLLLGETGVGKNVLAHHIHEQTPSRCNYSFVEPALSREYNLLDSELFGYVKGAFTGAVVGHDGAFAAAKGGTIFMDEIGNLSYQGQSKLLKVLDGGWYSPVGSCQHIDIDSRMVFATNKPVEYLTDITHFHTDLYYRISGETVTIPPLRERIEDVVPLAEHFLNRWNYSYKTSYVLDDGDKSLLMHYSYPGNVRELQGIVLHTARLSEEMVFNTEVLEETLSQRQVLIVPKAVFERSPVAQLDSLVLEKVCRQAERECIKKVLIITNSNLTEAAEILGISRTTLRSKIRLYGLDRPPDK
jgi:transcriptional regulator with GAF, ATPase, and Fis domain